MVHQIQSVEIGDGALFLSRDSLNLAPRSVTSEYLFSHLQSGSNSCLALTFRVVGKIQKYDVYRSNLKTLKCTKYERN